MPFAAAGGLGDVIGSLPAALRSAGKFSADIRVALPLYGCIDAALRAECTKEAEFFVRLSWRMQPCCVYSLRRAGVLYYFIENDYYFDRENIYGYPDDGERFAFFSMAVLDMLEHIGFYPDILHAHDWQGAPAILYNTFLFGGRQGYDSIKTVFTIHNIEYQGRFSMDMLEDIFALSPAHAKAVGWAGEINLMQGAVAIADQVTTVSPSYAKEIRTPSMGHGLDAVLRQHAAKLSGILNGIDYAYYNPTADPALTRPYTNATVRRKKENKSSLQTALGLPRRGDVPLFAVISRLVEHKGTDLLCQAAQRLLSQEDAQLIVLGTGENQYETFFEGLEKSFPQKMRALIKYDRALSKQIYAAADFFLMPSASEPCGLAQMIACRYGTIPIVRKTGGLSDSIKPFIVKKDQVQGCGLVFTEYSTDALYEKITQAIRIYKDKHLHQKMAAQIMKQDFSWHTSAGAYIDLYNSLCSPQKG